MSKFRRCLCKYTSPNNISICYLDDNNSNYYHDGSNAVLTGDEGDVMVYFPEFWYLGENTVDGWRLYVSETETEGFHHAPASLVGAYPAYMIRRSNKTIARSISGNIPSLAGYSSLISNDNSVSDIIGFLKNRGTGYHCIDYQQHCIIAWMFMARYKTRNSSGTLGLGPYYNDVMISNNSDSIKSGTLNSSGIHDTEGSAGMDERVKFLGLEDCWGFCKEIINSIALRLSSSYDNLVKVLIQEGKSYEEITDNSNSRGYEGEFGSGILKSIYGGEFMDLINSDTDLNTNPRNYFCDYVDLSESAYYTEGEIVPIARSATYIDSGVFSIHKTYYYTKNIYMNGFTGTRLAFDGTITVIDDPATFKSITDATLG